MNIEQNVAEARWICISGRTSLMAFVRLVTSVEVTPYRRKRYFLLFIRGTSLLGRGFLCFGADG